MFDNKIKKEDKDLNKENQELKKIINTQRRIINSLEKRNKEYKHLILIKSKKLMQYEKTHYLNKEIEYEKKLLQEDEEEEI